MESRDNPDFFKDFVMDVVGLHEPVNPATLRRS